MSIVGEGIDTMKRRAHASVKIRFVDMATKNKKLR